jgi:short-subunit dehydrogenase
VTGASAGLGAEFARQLAAAGAALVLVARDAARLEQFAAELREAHGVDVEVLPADLTTPDGLALVATRLHADAAFEAPAHDAPAHPAPIDTLVNNAGYGLRGRFDEHDIAVEENLHTLLTTVPMHLTHALIAAAARTDRALTVINVASVAAFVSYGTYSASKAFLLSFTRWANRAYRDRGITVTAVCPGLVRTEFHERMRVDAAAVAGIAWLTAPFVVRKALAAARRGRAVVVPSIRYKLVVALTKMLPPSLFTRTRDDW